MVSSTDLYDAPYANNYSTIRQGVSYINSSAANSQYLSPSQSMPMNEKIGHVDFSNPANYLQSFYAAQHITRVEIASINSAPYANANTLILAPNISNTYSRINENSAGSHTSPQICRDTSKIVQVLFSRNRSRSCSNNGVAIH